MILPFWRYAVEYGCASLACHINALLKVMEPDLDFIYFRSCPASAGEEQRPAHLKRFFRQAVHNKFIAVAARTNLDGDISGESIILSGWNMEGDGSIATLASADPKACLEICKKVKVASSQFLIFVKIVVAWKLSMQLGLLLPITDPLHGLDTGMSIQSSSQNHTNNFLAIQEFTWNRNPSKLEPSKEQKTSAVNYVRSIYAVIIRHSSRTTTIVTSYELLQQAILYFLPLTLQRLLLSRSSMP